MTLTEFLTARLDDEEATARQTNPWDDESMEGDLAAEERWDSQPHGRRCGWRLGEQLQESCSCGYPGRVLAEVTAKRQIVLRAVESTGITVENDWPLLILASVYADHPGFRDEWRG